MKKILVAAAIVVAFASTPVLAADDAPAADDVKAGIKCFFLPLLPECVDYWKGKGEDAKARWEEMKG